MSNEFIGRYEIVEELGRGGMGIVYRAIDPTIRRTIALKTLRLDSQSDKHDEVLRRFKHEAQLAGGMNHPNIVTIYDAGDDGPIFYIAMEFIEGPTLHSILQEQRLPLEKIIEFARQICSALDYAHARGVVHRDIKPANVMGSSLNALKIMDFGIAKSDLGLTMTGQVLGTPAYMSPEQVMGRPLDGRSDLFSFAVMLYQMVTGEMPFSGNTATTIIYKIANEHPIAPSDLDVTIHPGLSAVITKALSKVPDDRFQTGADLAKALENYKSQPVVARKAAVSPDASTVTVLLQAEATQPLPASPSAKGIVAAPPKAAGKKWIPGAIALLAVLAAGKYFMIAHRSLPAQTVIPQPGVTTPATPSQPSLSPATTEAKETPTAAVPEKAAPEFVELRVTSNPSGASVTINGKSEDAWVTPFTAKKLSPGSHDIAFSLQDYIPQTRKVKLVAGEPALVNADLIMSGGNIELNSDPAGALIFIDGKKLADQVTPTKVHVTAGQHAVMLRKPGFAEENTTVDIKDGQDYPYSPTLEKARAAGTSQFGEEAINPEQQERLRKALKEGKGIVAIFSEPSGASIAINGRSIGRMTPMRVPVPPGDYSISLSLPGYDTMQRRVTVEAGKVSRVQVKFAGR